MELKKGQKVYIFDKHIFAVGSVLSEYIHTGKIIEIYIEKYIARFIRNSIKVNFKDNYSYSKKIQYHDSKNIYFSFSEAAKVIIKDHIFEKDILAVESLEVKNISYKGTRKNYTVNDENPNILIIDKDYNVDGHGKSILAINLNYLDSINKKQKKKLINDINVLDNKILNIKGVKAWIRRKVLKKGDYNLSKKDKIKRYKKIISEFPILKKAIRRYKYEGII